jgi:MerR family transcriptional regulator, light-induced transcriptional regulator
MVCQARETRYAEQTMYTIKQAAMQAGLSVPVVRAWERRYGVVHPDRTAAGYRLYDDAAVERLKAMRALIANGWAPSSAAAAVIAGSAPPVELPDIRDDRGGTAAPDEGSPSPEARAHLRDAFVDAAATLDAAGVERVLDEMFASGSYEAAVERDVLPALEALGDAWADGRVDVAAEHAASHAVGRRLAGLYQAAARASVATGTVLVGLPPGARHELGALAFAVAARRAGLPVLYLGADLPIADWVATALRTKAAAAVIGAVTRSDARPSLAVARALAEAAPGIVIAFGGRGSPSPDATEWPQGTPTPMVLPDAIGEAAGAIHDAIGAGPA